MKIIFICGSLEPGKDGVGDYTRRLSGELSRQGYQTAIIALHDQHINKEKIEVQVEDGINLTTLRIPALLSSDQRYKKAKAMIQDISPDWISLQYVPYSFHKSGIPINLAKHLSKLHSTAKWHFMVHESYLGGNQKRLNHKIIKILQIFSLKRLNKIIAPKVVSTSIKSYQNLLAQIGIKSKLLGLFGNIKLNHHSETDSLLNKKNNNLKGVYFGSAPSIESHLVFAEKLKSYFAGAGHGMQLYICGNTGPRGILFAETIQEVCKTVDLEVIMLGELTSDKLSQIFFSADFGIARVPPSFLGKSSSVISMLEHGLPIWVPLKLEENINDHLDFRPELCFRALKELPQYKEKIPFRNRLPEVAKELLKELKEN